MPRLSRTNSCCGIGEFNGLELDPRGAIQAMRNTSKFAMYMFTDNNSVRGKRLAKFIQKHELAKSFVASPWVTNPNSGRKVCLWYFVPDWKKIKALELYKSKYKKNEMVKLNGVKVIVSEVVGDGVYDLRTADLSRRIYPVQESALNKITK